MFMLKNLMVGYCKKIIGMDGDLGAIGLRGSWIWNRWPGCHYVLGLGDLGF